MKKKRPIHYASEKGRFKSVKFLLENNCNVECEDSDVNYDGRFYKN